MEYIALIIGVFVSILLCMFGIAIKYYKAYWLISGYNTMSNDKKKNVDIEKLGGFIAKNLYIMSGIILIATFLISIKQMIVAGIIFFLIIPVSIYIINKAQTYDGNTRNLDGSIKTGTKVIVGIMVGFSILIMSGVGILLYFSNKPADYFIQGDTLKINGLYGEEIRLSDIVDITINKQIPQIEYKSNGSDLGSKKKGYFRLKDFGQVILFVDTEKPPFIFINTKSGLRIIYTNNPTETEKLFENLLTAWNKNNY